MEEYKRVIIFYPMTDKLAAGITFANLFKGWPPERLAVIADGTDVDFVKKQLGAGVKCIPLYSTSLVSTTLKRKDTLNSKVRSWISNKLGLYDVRIRSDVPESVVSFIDDFKPDVLFTPVGRLSTINFFNNLLDIRDIPVAVHIMDDWPATIFNNRFFKSIWKRKYDKAVYSFFQRAKYHLSICEAMEAEYQTRYGKDFKPFFNPVDPEEWVGRKNRKFAQDGTVRIVFAGKINNDTFSPIIDMCKAVEDASSRTGNDFAFDLYSPYQDDILINATKDLNHCHLKGFVSHDKIPDILMEHDILFLPFSFSESTKSYLKYSMSTNTAEYLISQTPILYYGPEVLAQYEFYSKRKTAFFVTMSGVDYLTDKLLEIMSSPDKRKSVVEAAMNVVEGECSVNVVCPKFASVLNTINNL